MSGATRGRTEDTVLAWARGLLDAASLDEFASVVAAPPAPAEESSTASLILEDASHELRHLAVGGADAQVTDGVIRYVESLVGVAPQCIALHAPWSGEYRASDHALLLPGGNGYTRLLMLPLRRDGELVGVYNIATRGEGPVVATLPQPWLEHLAALLSATLERLFDRARLLRSGMTDPLTGWNTRRYLLTRLREEVARCQRAGCEAACLVVDVDHLQAINERHGLTGGDRVLREVGARIDAEVRASDASAYLGSDQFAVLLPETNAALAARLADRILEALRAAPVEVAHGVRCTVAVSIGIAGFDGRERVERKAAADRWLAEAEAALHRAKQRGGNGYEIAID